MSFEKNVNKELSELMEKLLYAKKNIPDVIDYLYNEQVITKNQALKFLVKTKYKELLRQGNGCRSSQLDCAVEFEVSSAFVRRAVYDSKK